jgi:ABC-2 type transport system ATP-binding protein
MSIDVEQITKVFADQKALDGVSFSVKTGEIVGLLGPNGAGKSTLMKIITGVLYPTSGRVRVYHYDVLKDPLEVKKHIGYLPEHNPLYTEMYVQEYLENVARIYKMGRGARTAVQDIISLTGLSPERTKKIGALSKGYRQRVGLAQALIHDPEVLILDEPTSGLDPNQIVEIRKLISDAGKEKTVILSTHIMQEVEAICDRVVIIDQGRIVADDSTSQLHTKSDDVQTVLVEFQGNVKIESLRTIPGVIQVMKADDTNYIIRGSGQEDLRPKIFQYAVDQGLTVLSQQVKERSLEEIFQELTLKKEKNNQ